MKDVGAGEIKHVTLVPPLLHRPYVQKKAALRPGDAFLNEAVCHAQNKGNKEIERMPN